LQRESGFQGAGKFIEDLSLVSAWVAFDADYCSRRCGGILAEVGDDLGPACCATIWCGVDGDKRGLVVI
jgi:hypothetical protein